MRLANGLVWARRVPHPSCIPTSRPRRGSAKAQGLQFEKMVGEALGAAAKRGVWFEFQDQLGRAYCQVDFLIEGQQSVLVLEVKLTWLPEAHQKLEGLYLPVVSKALSKPARGLVVARRLVPEARLGARITSDLKLGVEWCGEAATCVYWPGSGPLIRGSGASSRVAA